MLKSVLRMSSCLFILCSVLFVQSCKKTELKEEEATSSERIEELRAAVAGSTGSLLTDVQYDAATKSFIISNDALVSLKDADARFPKSAVVRGDANGSQQRVYTYTVSRTNATNIVYYADATVPSSWVAALDQAIANWNSTNSLVVMKRVTATTTTTPGKGKKPGTTTSTIPPYNVLVTTMYNTTSTVAQAYYPSYTGSAGFRVDINTYYNYLDDSRKIFAITHELGHTIGFTHTNESYGSLIPGTPESDPNSIMNSSILYWNGFTPYDLLALKTIYPK